MSTVSGKFAAKAVVLGSALALSLGVVVPANAHASSLEKFHSTAVLQALEGGKSRHNVLAEVREFAQASLYADAVAPSGHSDVRAAYDYNPWEPLEKTADDAQNRFYVVVVKDAKNKKTNVSQKKGKAAMARALSYWKREANGALSGAKIAAVKTLKLNNSCGAARDHFKVTEKAEKLFPKVDFGYTRNHIVVFAPTKCQGGTLGTGTLGEVGMWSGGSVTILDGSWSTVAHEVGHNFGLQHSGVTYKRKGGKKVTADYMGFYGVMAAGVKNFPDLGALPPAQQILLGIPGAKARQKELKAGKKTRTYTMRVYAVDAKGKKKNSVRITNNKGKVTHLEYRSGAGADKNALYKKLPKNWWFSTPAGDRLSLGAGVVASSVSKSGRVTVLGKRTGNTVSLSTAKGKKFTGSGYGFSVIKMNSKYATIKVTVTKK